MPTLTAEKRQELVTSSTTKRGLSNASAMQRKNRVWMPMQVTSRLRLSMKRRGEARTKAGKEAAIWSELKSVPSIVE